MALRLKHALVVTIALTGVASPAFAQPANEHTGSPVPNHYNAEGRHVFGSWGPLDQNMYGGGAGLYNEVPVGAGGYYHYHHRSGYDPDLGIRR